MVADSGRSRPRPGARRGENAKMRGEIAKLRNYWRETAKVMARNCENTGAKLRKCESTGAR